jgi:hypothetical protein
LAVRLETALKELAWHGKEGTHFNGNRLNLNAVKALDATNPVIAKDFGVILGDDYKLTAQAAHRARMLGYNVIFYESVRDPGHLNIAVIGDFDKVLTVDPNVKPVRVPRKLQS